MDNHLKYWFMYCDARKDGKGLGGKTYEQAVKVIKEEMVKDGLSENEADRIIKNIARQYETFSRKAAFEMD